MIINRRGNSVWINTSTGVTVYFNFHEEHGRIMCRVETPCGVPQIDYYQDGLSILKGRKMMRELNQNDADSAFDKIMNWPSNKNKELGDFQQVSYKEPLITNP